MSFQKYMDTIKGNFHKAIKVEWLNPDETVDFEFTNALYDINVDLSVNYQNGSRRTCTLTLNNDRNQFPINFNNIWFGQKFKLYMGIYIAENTPYYFPQGVFYITNPNEVYQPSTRTIKINGVDKWAFLDGTLHGKLSETYQTNIDVSLYDATKELLKTPITPSMKLITDNNITRYFEVSETDNRDITKFRRETSDNGGVKFVSNSDGVDALVTITAKSDLVVSFQFYCDIRRYELFEIKLDNNTIEYYNIGERPGTISQNKRIEVVMKQNQQLTFKSHLYSVADTNYFQDICVSPYDAVDPIEPFISPLLLTKTSYVLNSSETRDMTQTYYTYDSTTQAYAEWDGRNPTWSDGKWELYVLKNVINCPYTAKVERGKTYADVLLEYATILCAHVYYDANGRLTIEPMIDTADDITDTNKEVLWRFTVEEKQLLGLNTTYNFDKVYNDIIVLGNIANGYQFKARVQNRNPMSDTCVQKIGLKTKEPFEDNQYYSDDQCKELAIYYAKVDTILQKSGSISSTPLYHLDVNKLVTVSTPNNNMSKELFLITGYTLNSSESMSVNVTSVNVLNDFSVMEADLYG